MHAVSIASRDLHADHCRVAGSKTVRADEDKNKGCHFSASNVMINDIGNLLINMQVCEALIRQMHIVLYGVMQE